jgi:hypothetical protein
VKAAEFRDRRAHRQPCGQPIEVRRFVESQTGDAIVEHVAREQKGEIIEAPDRLRAGMASSLEKPRSRLA